MPLYKELEIMSYAQAGKLPRIPIGSDFLSCVYLTGHHIIPDHCFYICKGGRAAQGVTNMRIMGTASYSTDDAPVIMLSSDESGGKMLNHGYVHDYFDPIEKEQAHNGTWTYEVVRGHAIDSIVSVFGDAISADTIQKALDDYFIEQIGLKLTSTLRCGEHTSLANSAYSPKARQSPRLRKTPY